MPLRCFRQPVKAFVSSPSRALETVYQNTTGRPILVIATIICTRGVAGATNAYARGKTENANPPALVHSVFGLYSYSSATLESIFGTVVFCVPNNYYYMVDSVVGAGCTVVLNMWREVEL